LNPTNFDVEQDAKGGRSGDLAPAAARGRKSCDASSRKSRSRFFCAPCESNDPHLRVTEAAGDDSAGAKTGECVRVCQVTARECFGHRQIMPDLSSPETGFKPYENRPRRLIETPFLPTLKPEEPILIKINTPEILGIKASGAQIRFADCRCPEARLSLM
jgi:hypothetical protein